jgi:hypothetical protein
MADESGIHVVEESSSGVVPAKCPNKSVRAQAEGMEGRPLAKENTLQQPRSGQVPGWTSMRAARCGGEKLNGSLSATDPRWEPDAVVPRVRVCAGGGGQPPSLPRPISAVFCSLWIVNS